MEKISLNFHLKLQEMCDCYMETDFLAEMRHMTTQETTDQEEAAMKYLALSILHTITEQAKKLSFKRKGPEVTVKMKNTKKELLPAPSLEIFNKIVEIMRSILHLHEEKGELPFSLGLRTGEVNLEVKIKREEDKESVKFKFPVS